MIPLIDGDLLRYQVGFATQRKNEEGEVHISPFDDAAELLYEIVRSVCRAVESEETPVIYLTGSQKEVDVVNRIRKQQDKEPLVYIPNFREAIAVTAEYKGGRDKSDRPFHYDNLTNHIINRYNFVITNGIEADDAICIAHTENPDNSVICSRDKDLRMCPGLHYGWACGKQPEFGPDQITKEGYLEYKNGKLTGGGFVWFCAQMLTGDAVDNIKGVYRVGPAKAYKLLEGSTEPLEVVKELYQEHFGEDWRDRFYENALLLNMIKHVDPTGKGRTFGWEAPTRVEFSLITPADIDMEGPFLGKAERQEDEV